MIEITVRTRSREDMVDITPKLEEIVRKNNFKNGILYIYVPHTTAGITVNENADPSVKVDIMSKLSELVPRSGSYHHLEGNADAHIKASIVGSSLTIFVEEGRLVLGTWQGVFFCEFDGPRTRRCLVKFVGSET
ncbi:MAG: YjbQ family protein [Thermotogae bacterium]|nr:YjbQ family protein [Thermotogota bacterium]